jgi:hypothetical protein
MKSLNCPAVFASVYWSIADSGTRFALSIRAASVVCVVDATNSFKLKDEESFRYCGAAELIARLTVTCSKTDLVSYELTCLVTRDEEVAYLSI